MKFPTRLIVLTLTLLLAFSVTAFAKSANQQRTEIQELHTQALTNLYELSPDARDVINNAYGYATLSATGSQLGLLGGAHGRGLAVNNRTGEQLYMKMEAYQVGIGLGVKEYDLIFVFGTKHAWDSFISGKFKVGGAAEVSATDGYSGGAIEGADIVAKDTWVYQITTKGLAVGAMLKGLSIYPNRKLNS
ncbi:YSC84-related protein [Selenomonas infelix]|nr:YSC84-related protein [Selenomonas infelix]